MTDSEKPSEAAQAACAYHYHPRWARVLAGAEWDVERLCTCERIDRAIKQAVAEQKERDACIAQFWGECECGSAESMYEIAAAIREGKA